MFGGREMPSMIQRGGIITIWACVSAKDTEQRQWMLPSRATSWKQREPRKRISMPDQSSARTLKIGQASVFQRFSYPKQTRKAKKELQKVMEWPRTVLLKI